VFDPPLGAAQPPRTVAVPVAGAGRRAARVILAPQRVARLALQRSSIIRRAARRTSSGVPPASLDPSITAFSFSRVRSDAGILSIGVLLRRGRPNTGPR